MVFSKKTAEFFRNKVSQISTHVPEAPKRWRRNIQAATRTAVALACGFGGVACTSTPPPDNGDPLQQLTERLMASDFDFSTTAERVVTRSDADIDSDDPPPPDILDQAPTIEDIEDFLLPPLEPENVVFADRLEHGRNPENAYGVVVAQTLPCSWDEIERVLMSEDQMGLFEGTWESYERMPETDLEEYADGSATLTFPAFPTGLPEDPSASDIREEGLERTVLMTRNIADPSSTFGQNVGAYEVAVEMRHGCINAIENPRHLVAIRSFNITSGFTDTSESTGIGQNITTTLYIDNTDGTTTRISGSWIETVIAGEANNSDFVKSQAAIKSFQSGEELAEVACGATL